MANQIKEPAAVWELEHYLDRTRKEIDRKLPALGITFDGFRAGVGQPEAIGAAIRASNRLKW